MVESEPKTTPPLQQQEAQPDSVLNFYRQMIRLQS